MQPRRIARELALLGASQLPSTPAKLERKTLQDFIVAAIRSLSEEIGDTLDTASDEVHRSDRLLHDTEMAMPIPLQPDDRTTDASTTSREAAGEHVEVARLKQVRTQLARLERAIQTADPSRTTADTMLSELSGLASQSGRTLDAALQYITSLETRLRGARQTMEEAIATTQTAINRVGAAVALPEFVRIAEDPDVRAYAGELLAAIHHHKATIDDQLQQALVGWQFNRLGRIERDILRIAVVEMDILKTAPDRVAMNEAVELAKKYGGDDAPSFVNGVLRRFHSKDVIADPTDRINQESAPELEVIAEGEQQAV